MEQNPEEYWRSRAHKRHTAGVPEAPESGEYMQMCPERLKEVGNRMRFNAMMDKAWVVMLHRQGLVPTETARKLFPVLDEEQQGHGWGGEDWVTKALDGDEDTASAVNYGRTLQEPMARMMMREALLHAFDELVAAMGTLLDLSDEHADVIMAGHSHWAHAQPTTYGAYLLTAHEGLARGLEQLELAWRHTNQNSGGCGACSGTGWPVDREIITDLLGFDSTIVPSYDCEASQEEMLTIMFAASNIAVTLSRVALDLNVWVTEEWDILEVAMQWRGVSSFMPQKANAGNTFERIRMASNDVLGNMMTVLFSFKNEPVQDVLPVYRAERYVLEGLCHVERCLGMFRHCIPHVRPRKERMSQLLREGYSGAPDLAITMVRQHGYGGRCAHRICATMVRIARERGIKPQECTGGLLDEAARISGDPEPNLSDEVVRADMSLEHFFDKHTGQGDPNPAETRRLVGVRRQQLAEIEARQQARKDRLDEADQRLEDAIKEIMGEDT